MDSAAYAARAHLAHAFAITMRSNDDARVASRRVGSFARARETSRVDVSRVAFGTNSSQTRARAP